MSMTFPKLDSTGHDPVMAVTLGSLIKDGLRHVGLGVVAVFIIVGIKLEWEHLQSGKWVDQVIYYYLTQATFPSNPFEADEGVVILDISGLGAEQAPGTEIYRTSPDKVAAILRAVGNKKPKAVGVDIDFGPIAEVNDDRTELLKTCSDLQIEGVPVLLGVGDRIRGNTDAELLGDAKVKDFAGWTWGWNSYPALPLYWDKDRESRLWGLATGLVDASASAEVPPGKNGWWLECCPTIKNENGRGAEAFEAPSAWLDYAFLFKTSSVVQANTPNLIKESAISLQNKIVLIGDVTRTADLVPVPTLFATYVPGIKIHACGVRSLLDGPIWRPTHHARLLLDVGIAGAIILGIFALRIGIYLRLRKDLIDMHAAHWLLTGAACVVILLLTWWCARHFRLVWTDSVFVILGLMVHHRIEVFLRTSAERGAEAIIREENAMNSSPSSKAPVPPKKKRGNHGWLLGLAAVGGLSSCDSFDDPIIYRKGGMAYNQSAMNSDAKVPDGGSDDGLESLPRFLAAYRTANTDDDESRQLLVGGQKAVVTKSDENEGEDLKSLEAKSMQYKSAQVKVKTSDTPTPPLGPPTTGSVETQSGIKSNQNYAIKKSASNYVIKNSASKPASNFEELLRKLERSKSLSKIRTDEAKVAEVGYVRPAKSANVFEDSEVKSKEVRIRAGGMIQCPNPTCKNHGKPAMQSIFVEVPPPPANARKCPDCSTVFGVIDPSHSHDDHGSHEALPGEGGNRARAMGSETKQGAEEPGRGTRSQVPAVENLVRPPYR